MNQTLIRRALLKAARTARTRAYAPYSKFKVGAALRARDGRIFAGCNVENASYGLCNCAERTALFTAVAAGCKARTFSHLLVIGDTPTPIAPCGACRQVMLELGGPNLVVWQGNLAGEWCATTAEALLPDAFVLTPSPPL
jgi:cytidine deaminase